MIYKNKNSIYKIQFDKIIVHNESCLLDILKSGIDNGPLTLFNLLSNESSELTGVSYIKKDMKLYMIKPIVKGFLKGLDESKQLYVSISIINQNENEYNIVDFEKKTKLSKIGRAHV